jgi:hypothetical protein
MKIVDENVEFLREYEAEFKKGFNPCIRGQGWIV